MPLYFACPSFISRNAVNIAPNTDQLAARNDTSVSDPKLLSLTATCQWAWTPLPEKVNRVLMDHLRTSFVFVLASILPAGCLLLGAFLAGPWPAIALLSITAVVLAMDRVGLAFDARLRGLDRLPWIIGLAHFGTLGATIWAVCLPQHLNTAQTLAMVLAMGLFAGQVSNACAHELIHRTDRASRWLGIAMYVSILNGQHASSHLLVHHRYAGTNKDPNSPPIGKGFYRFALKASIEEFRGGWRAETQKRQARSFAAHPYATYLAGGALALVAALWLGGLTGALILLGISLHAQMQLLLSDYVQHYGLRRKIAPNGKAEPMGPQHSWNAPHVYSGALMLNAPRHSDHHMNPSRRFYALEYRSHQMPTLPYSVPVMGAAALIPPLWRRLMDDRARRWSEEPPKTPQTPTTTLNPPLTT